MRVPSSKLIQTVSTAAGREVAGDELEASIRFYDTVLKRIQMNQALHAHGMTKLIVDMNHREYRAYIEALAEKM